MRRHLRRAANHARRLVPRSRYEIVLFVLTLGLLMAGFIFLWAASLKIPDIQSIEERKIIQSTKIFDRTGTVLLDDLGDDITRTSVPITEISQHIQNAAIAIEDADFYRHRGIKITSIIRSVLVNLISAGYEQGGSTITQQVVKNSILTTDKTVSRKLKEWVLALKLEQTISKSQILELYLNESPYGGSMYGVEEASLAFFGKHAKDIGLAEAAYLAAIPQAPTYYSPYGNHLEDLETRKNLVLAQMEENNLISAEEFETAKTEKVVFQPQQVKGIRAPHFVFYVREQLEREFGRRALEENSWRIITTLDAELEAEGEKMILPYALENTEKYNATNASLLALNPQTGDILAMIGSRDFFDKEIDGNVNIATALRQPGSAFKPVVYAAAFMKGFAPETVLFDVPTQFSTDCPPESVNDQAPCYYPGNYDNIYRGPVTLRNALAQSINIPAVKLLYLVGLSDALSVARSLGISTLAGPDRYGLTLVLGGGEVRLLDLVSAYGVFANAGIRTPPRAILKIEGRDGTVVKEYPLSPQQVIPKDVALTVSDVLSDNVARTPAFGAGSALNIPGHHVASKTGTTNDYRDAWIVGYTTDLVIGAWAGNNDNKPMEKKVAGFIIAPLWKQFFDFGLTLYPDKPFQEPPLLTRETDKPILRGIWQGGDIVNDNGREKVTVNVHSILYWLDKKDPRGAVPTNPGNDPQFTRWEYSVRRWAAQNGLTDGSYIYR
ncbi:MAG: transglycosylase domain-containing protein [Patescibacteria group bacterium]